MKINELKPVIQSLDKAEEVLGQLGQTYAEVSAIEARYNSQIAELEAKKAQETQAYKEAIRGMESDIVIYVRANLTLFRDGQKSSRDFCTGTIKTLLVEEFLYPEKEELIEAIRDYFGKNADKFITTKEDVLKNALKAHLKKNPEVLAALGITKSEDISVVIKPIGCN